MAPVALTASRPLKTPDQYTPPATLLLATAATTAFSGGLVYLSHLRFLLGAPVIWALLVYTPLLGIGRLLRLFDADTVGSRLTVGSSWAAAVTASALFAGIPTDEDTIAAVGLLWLGAGSLSVASGALSRRAPSHQPPIHTARDRLLTVLPALVVLPLLGAGSSALGSGSFSSADASWLMLPLEIVLRLVIAPPDQLIGALWGFAVAVWGLSFGAAWAGRRPSFLLLVGLGLLIPPRILVRSPESAGTALATDAAMVAALCVGVLWGVRTTVSFRPTEPPPWLDRLLAGGVLLLLCSQRLLGAAQRRDLEFLVFHLAFGISLVLPACIHLAVRAHFSAVGPWRRVAVGIGWLMLAQLGIGALAYLVPGSIQLGGMTGILDLLLVLLHQATGWTLLVLAATLIAWSTAPSSGNVVSSPTA